MFNLPATSASSRNGRLCSGRLCSGHASFRLVPGFLGTLVLSMVLVVPTARAEPGSQSSPAAMKPAIVKPVAVKPAIVPAVGRPSFGFSGSLARVTRPALRLVLPRDVPSQASTFEGFG